jgi:hypothetical protein
MRVRTIYVITGAIWGVLTGAAMAMLAFLILGLVLIWFLPDSIVTAIAVGAAVAAFVLMFGGCVCAALSSGRQRERSYPEPAGRRRAILWLLVSCVAMVVALACAGVVEHMVRREQIRALAAVAQGQKTLAVQHELPATFHSVGELRAYLRPDTSGFDVSAWFSGQRGGAYRLELRVLGFGDETLFQSIETMQLGAGESSTQRFIEYREIIAGYYREIAKNQDMAVSVSLKLVAQIYPLLTPAEQTVLGLADLGGTFQYAPWSKRASATTTLDVHFIVCGSGYEIVHPGWTPGRCTGGGSRRS